MLEELIELFFLGVISTGCLAFVCGIIYLAITMIKIFMAVSAGFLVVISIGWCTKHYDDFVSLFSKPVQPDLFKMPRTNYGNQTLDGLSYFEKKYGMTTVQFMAFVYKDLIPHGMNNLDYIEWVAMANALGTFKDPNEEE
jgi:hypothetical protein